MRTFYIRLDIVIQVSLGANSQPIIFNISSLFFTYILDFLLYP